MVRGLPDLRIGMHLCRGNRGGHWHAEGSYEAVAEKLFNALDIGFFFLEYDTPRAGDFSPLRFVPQDKSIVLGLVSTKMNFLEDKSALRAPDRRGKPPRPTRAPRRQPTMRLCQHGVGQPDLRPKCRRRSCGWW